MKDAHETTALAWQTLTDFATCAGVTAEELRSLRQEAERLRVRCDSDGEGRARAALALLCPDEPEHWRRLALLHEQRSAPDSALACYQHLYLLGDPPAVLLRAQARCLRALSQPAVAAQAEALAQQIEESHDR